MADDLKKILYGDTQTSAVEAVNAAIEQVNDNQDRIETLEDTVVKTISIDKTPLNFMEDQPNQVDLPVYTKTGTVQRIIELAGEASTITLFDDKHLEDPDRYHYGVTGGTKNIDLPVYSAEKIDEFIGQISSGMRYIGVIGNFIGSEEEYPGENEDGQPIVTNPDGSMTLCITRDPTDHRFMVGDSMKVDAEEWYMWPSEAIVEGFEQRKLEIGDLLICDDAVYKEDEKGILRLVHLSLDVVPSGDDGDVYSDVSWSGEDNGHILVTAAGSTRGRKVKPTNKKIVDTITGSQNVATDAAVKTYSDASIKKVDIDTGNGNWLMAEGANNILYLTNHHNYIIVGVYNFEGKPVIAKITHNFKAKEAGISTHHSIEVDETKIATLNGGFVLLNRISN